MEKYITKDQHFWHFMGSSVFVVLLITAGIILNFIGKNPNEVTFFDLFVVSLATFRITRLLVYDLVADFIRDSVEDAAFGYKKTLRDLLGCPWCTSVWVALGITFIYFISPVGTWTVIIIAIAGLGVLITIFANLLGRMHQK